VSGRCAGSPLRDALSIALDLDDYICCGHDEHTDVLVLLMLRRRRAATDARRSSRSSRRGSAVRVRSARSTAWSVIHTGGAAFAAGRMLGLDREPPPSAPRGGSDAASQRARRIRDVLRSHASCGST
jgi:hypothetical protein